jgi:hypothetical protein
MRWTIVAGLSGIAVLALAAMPASAAPKKRVPAVTQSDVSVSSQARARRTTQVRQARSRTRITVRPRSYLDPGTEVLPGERKYTDYAIGPATNQRPSSILDNTGPHHRSPLPGPFELAGRNNPMQW